ncbi:MAG: DUF1285 domain-containing protein [bacterium]|nr:DUF1285 domain-containing protein [bacterium]
MMKNPDDPLIEHYDIKILKNGTWLYNGTPINRHNLVKLFATVLQKDAEGRYWLITPYERGVIGVEDVPFTAIELRVESAGRGQKLSFRTNLDDWVEAGPSHPIRVAHDAATGEPSPYVMVRGQMEARISRAVYYELAALAVPDDADAATLGVWSRNEFYAIGRAG